MGNEQTLADKLRQLNAAYAAGIPERLSNIETAMQAFMRQPDEPDRLELLHKLLHSLAGSAGTFGFDELGRLAREFEDRCSPWLQGEAVDPRELARLPGLLAGLRMCADS